jgi:hypothetical protein
MPHAIPILNYADIISQTMSFTIAYTWRESIRDFIKELCPPSWTKGPFGAIVFAVVISLFIITLTLIIENLTEVNNHLYEYKKQATVKAFDAEEFEKEDHS